MWTLDQKVPFWNPPFNLLISGHSPVHAKSFSCVQLFVSLWTIAHQALLSMEFSRQEFQSGLPFLPPGNLPDPRIEQMSFMSPALGGRFFTTKVTWEPKVKELVTQLLSDSLQPHGLQPTRLLCPQNFPGKNTGARCHFPLQGIFLSQGSNPCLQGLLCWQVDSLPLHHLGSPVLHIQGINIQLLNECVAY